MPHPPLLLYLQESPHKHSSSPTSHFRKKAWLPNGRTLTKLLQYQLTNRSLLRKGMRVTALGYTPLLLIPNPILIPILNISLHLFDQENTTSLNHLNLDTCHTHHFVAVLLPIQSLSALFQAANTSPTSRMHLRSSHVDPAG